MGHFQILELRLEILSKYFDVFVIYMKTYTYILISVCI